MSIPNLLQVEIEDGFKKLQDFKVGSEEHKNAVDELTKLMDRAIEIERIESDNKEKAESRKIDQDLRLKQMEEDRKDRWVKNGLTGISVIGGFALTIWGAMKSWKFEETGTITSTAGRKFINNLFFKR